MTMAWVAVGSAVVGGAASIYSANKSSGAARSAAQAQTDAANQANATQLQMFQQQQAANEPFRQNGLTAQSQYMRMLGLQPYNSSPSATDQAAAAQAYLAANPDVAASAEFGNNPYQHYIRYGQYEGRTWGAPSSTGSSGSGTISPSDQQAAFDQWRNTPGYQFGFAEQQRALDSSASAAGGLFSGQAAKDLAKWSQGYADQQGYTPYMNRLASLAGMAQTANQQNAAAGQNYANQYGQNVNNAGMARASGLIGSANAWGQGISNATGMIGGALNQWSAYRNNQPSGFQMQNVQPVNEPVPYQNMIQPQLYTGGY